MIETKQSGKKVAILDAWVLLFSLKCQEMEGSFQFGDYFGKQEYDSRLSKSKWRNGNENGNVYIIVNLRVPKVSQFVHENSGYGYVWVCDQ